MTFKKLTGHLLCTRHFTRNASFTPQTTYELSPLWHPGVERGQTHWPEEERGGVAMSFCHRSPWSSLLRCVASLQGDTEAPDPRSGGPRFILTVPLRSLSPEGWVSPSIHGKAGAPNFKGACQSLERQFLCLHIDVSLLCLFNYRLLPVASGCLAERGRRVFSCSLELGAAPLAGVQVSLCLGTSVWSATSSPESGI